jgi:hypothetical protein
VDEQSEMFDPLDWERVDVMIALGTVADQDVSALGDALTAAVRDVASTAPDDDGQAVDGECPPWPLRAALLRQPIQPDIEAQAVLHAHRYGNDLPPRLLVYYMGLLARLGRPKTLTMDRALDRARHAMAAVPGVQQLTVLPVTISPNATMAALAGAEGYHFAE